MNVTCDKCQKRYAIADEKVRGKSVKIRCKQCQNLISVQGPSAQAVDTSGAPAGPSPWEEESTRAMPSLDMSAAWYAMVKGTQIGPLDLVALEQKVKAGELTLRTYLWKQGMADWKRASDVPEVSPVFAGVSVGSTVPARPSSKASAAVQRDVAVANEMPSPEITNRQAPAAGGNGNGNGHGHAEASAEPTDAAGQQFDDQATQAVIQSPLNAASGGLGDLFNDAPATDPQPDAAASTGDTDASGGPDAPANDGASGAPADRFAALGEADPSLAPPPGEATKFFIAQAGVNKRNPPWKIALFVFGGLGLPVGILFLLSTLHIVPLNVTRTDENGQEVQQSFFSAEGISGLKDILSGEEKRRQAAAAERKKRQQEEQAKRAQLAGNSGGSNAGTGTSATGTTDSPSNKDLFGSKTPTPGLADFYKDDTGKGGDKIPKDRQKGDGTSKPEVVVSAKWSEAAQKTVNDKIKSFQACIEEELRKNPNLKVGKVIVTANVGGSGTVTSASIAPEKYNTSSWGECMKKAAKRVVFPALDDPGDTTAVEIPITVGVALGD